jgi:YD repeat-containing protein
VMGLRSEFGYGDDDFVSSLRTPYGITTFRHEPNAYTVSGLRFIEATDPLGGTEHLEYGYETPSLAATAPAGEVPAGFAAYNTSLDYYNTFYWDKRAWAEGRNDLSKAVITHWMVGIETQADGQFLTQLPHSVKAPLEGRIWYAYPGQPTETQIRWWREPSRVGRLLDDGTSQITETTYNTAGSVLSRTDPVGRQTTYTYAADGVDLLQVRQATAGGSDLLATYVKCTGDGDDPVHLQARGRAGGGAGGERGRSASG